MMSIPCRPWTRCGLICSVDGNPVDVPLYCCELCGWACTGFRVDAVREHQADCPECSGTIRLVFAIGTPPVDPDPTLTDLQAERDRAHERSLRWRARARAQTRGRTRRILGSRPWPSHR